jgi:hypothetical protein
MVLVVADTSGPLQAVYILQVAMEVMGKKLLVEHAV